MKLFIVCVDASTSVEERDAFTKHLRALRIGFWHHIDHLWIIATPDTNQTSENIHFGMREFMSTSVASIALEVEVKDYNAFCTQVAHSWLYDYLMRPKVDQEENPLARLLAENSDQ